jgi:hypothetical protein
LALKHWHISPPKLIAKQMLRAANGIEHASGYLCQNFERFMDIGTNDDQGQKEEAEMAQALGTCRHILGASRAVSYFMEKLINFVSLLIFAQKCRAIADQIVASLCERKVPKMRNLCAAMTRNWDNSFLQNERTKKPPMVCFNYFGISMCQLLKFIFLLKLP